jgi:hypothetical protein
MDYMDRLIGDARSGVLGADTERLAAEVVRLRAAVERVRALCKPVDDGDPYVGYVGAGDVLRALDGEA